MIERVNAYVLSSRKFKDSLRLAHLFTLEYGVQTFLFRTGKKGENISFFQPLNAIQFSGKKQEGKLEIAKDMSLSEIYSTIPFHVEKSTVALFISEFLYRCLPEHYVNEEVFHLIQKTTLRLDSSEKTGTLPIHFLAHFAMEMGFLSEEYEITFENTRTDEAILHESLKLFISTSIESDVISNLNRDQRKTLLEELIAFCSAHLDTSIRLNSLEMFHEIFD
jgi:DNA repair protein RecO (recombination protein O)